MEFWVILNKCISKISFYLKTYTMEFYQNKITPTTKLFEYDNTNWNNNVDIFHFDYSNTGDSPGNHWDRQNQLRTKKLRFT